MNCTCRYSPRSNLHTVCTQPLSDDMPLYARCDFSSISHAAVQPDLYSSGLAETVNTAKKCELNRQQEIKNYNLIKG